MLLSRLKKRGPLKELKHFHILGGLIEGAAFVRTFKEGNDLEIKPFLRTFFSSDLGKNYGDMIIKIRNSFLGQMNKFCYVFENCEKLALMVLIRHASIFVSKI